MAIDASNLKCICCCRQVLYKKAGSFVLWARRWQLSFSSITKTQPPPPPKKNQDFHDSNHQDNYQSFSQAKVSNRIPPAAIEKMCVTAIYENPSCGCRWLQIQQQCQANGGFSLCGRFGRGDVTYPPDEFKSERFACPVHDLYGAYDRNQIRKSSLKLLRDWLLEQASTSRVTTGMIKKERNVLRFGLGPRKKDPGFEVNCAVM